MTSLKTALLTALTFLTLQAWPALAQTPPAWQTAVQQADDAYWAAYNRADPQAMNAFLADDVEFYHDRGGMIKGKAALSAVNDGMATSKNKIRREAAAGTVHIFPMRNDNDVYGAIVTGEHLFYVTPKDKPEFFVGRSYFTQLMLLQNGAWKVARIFSYEHVNADHAEK
jgi:ketosteroid isomerase-like protein